MEQQPTRQEPIFWRLVSQKRDAGRFDVKRGIAGKQKLENTNFIFIELAGLEDLKAFDGLAVGAFTDMRGKPVTVKAEDFPQYLANTLEVLDSTRTASGELVGLPIDMTNHDHQGGAGWIKGVRPSDKPNVLQFMADWTDDGKEAIRSNKRRFFSPSIDPFQKVILGGSMTNWPASRDEKYRMKLRPLELSSQIQIQEIAMEETLLEKLTDLGNQIVQAIKGREPAEALPLPEQIPPKESDMTEPLTVAEFMQTPEAIAELERRAAELAAELLKAEQLKSKVVDFAKRVTAEGEYALALPAAELSAAILGASDAEKVIELLGKVIGAKVANFAERGHAGNQDEPQGRELPGAIKALLSAWVGAGKEVSEFFAINPELGAASEFNLSEFKKE